MRAIAFVAAFVSCVTFAAAAESGWIADSSTGCRVYNPHPQPNESITWSGACGNGLAQGRGLLKWFEGGKLSATFDVEYRDGKMEGHGIATFANGDRFEGEYRDDKRNGHGKEVNFDGQRFEGEFRDGKKNGRGRESWSDGASYEGNWRNGKPDGLGKYIADGETFEGTWIDGCFKKGSQRAAIARPLNSCP
jgi:hypothetical protein